MSQPCDPLDFAVSLDAVWTHDENGAPLTGHDIVGFDDPGFAEVDDLTVLRSGRMVTFQNSGEGPLVHAKRHRARCAA